MIISELQHEDSIWTWPERNAKRVSLWLPYAGKIEKLAAKRWKIDYNGGSVEFALSEVDFILLYGAEGQIDLEFLDDLRAAKIPLLIHRRNIPEPLLFYTPRLVDDADILSAQILTREHQVKNNYIAKELIAARLRSMQYELPNSDRCFVVARQTLLELRRASPQLARSIEAHETKRYWQWYYEGLGLDDLARREKSPINQALDAGSKFMYGIILRWILFHKMSPAHGFLHVTTSFPSLAYDLIEPYRYWFEKAAAQAWLANQTNPCDEKKLVAATLRIIKNDLLGMIYCPASHQNLRRKNLLHGIVLSLRVYFSGQAKRFVIPVEGTKKGGRPPKIGYKMPGGVTI